MPDIFHVEKGQEKTHRLRRFRCIHWTYCLASTAILLNETKNVISLAVRRVSVLLCFAASFFSTSFVGYNRCHAIIQTTDNCDDCATVCVRSYLCMTISDLDSLRCSSFCIPYTRETTLESYAVNSRQCVWHLFRLHDKALVLMHFTMDYFSKTRQVYIILRKKKSTNFCNYRFVLHCFTT